MQLWSIFEPIFLSYTAWRYNKTKLVSFCSELPEIYETGYVTSVKVCLDVILTPCLRCTKILQKGSEILVELCNMADNQVI